MSKHRGFGLGLASLLFLACGSENGESSRGAGGTGSTAGASAAGGSTGVGATRATGGSAVAGSSVGYSTVGGSTINGSNTSGSPSNGGASATNAGGSSSGAGSLGGAGTSESSSVAGTGNTSGSGGSAGRGGSSAPSYAVVVQAAELLSSGLVLQLNGGSNLSPAPGTATAFAAKLNANASYSVTVLTQPSNPQQICRVKDGTGTVAAADATVAVTCTQLARYYLSVDATDKSISTYVIDEPSGRSTYVGKTASEKVPGVVVVHPTGKYAYVLNTSDSTLSQYAINPDGSLTSLGADVSAGTGARSMTLDPIGSRVYVTTSSNVMRLTVGANGVLSAPPTEAVSGATLSHVAFHPSGKYLYVVDTGNGASTGSVVQYNVNAADGALTLGASSATGKSPSAMVVDPDGKFVYVVNAGSNDVSQYAVNANGSLASVAAAPTVPVGTKPVAMVLDPRGRYAYVVNADGATVSQLKLSQGVLSAAGASTIATEPNPASILVSPTGNYVYVANTSGNSVSQFTVASDGTLAANAPPRVPAQLSPSALGLVTGTSHVKQFGRFAYIANGDADSISRYTIDRSTGALGGFTTMAIPGGGPNTVVVDPTATRAYVVNGFGRTIGQYTIEPTGALSAIGTYYVLEKDTAPTALAVHPSNRFAYVTNCLDNSVSLFTIEPSGALKAVPSAKYTSTDFLAPAEIAIEPSGRYAYAATMNGKIAQFTVGSNGALTAMTPLNVAAGGQPTSFGITPDVRYLYAVNSLDDTVSQYTIKLSGSNPGALEPLGSPNTVTTGVLPFSIALEPTGRYAYVANAGSGSISQYGIASGALSLLSPATVAAGPTGTSSPSAVAVDPAGQYVYAADKRESAGAAWQYKLSAAANGTLEPMSPAASVPGEIYGRSITIAAGRE